LRDLHCELSEDIALRKRKRRGLLTLQLKSSHRIEKGYLEWMSCITT